MTAAIYQLVAMFTLTQKTNVFHAHKFRQTDAFNVTLQMRMKRQNYRHNRYICCKILILILSQY